MFRYKKKKKNDVSLYKKKNKDKNNAVKVEQHLFDIVRPSKCLANKPS